MMRGTLIPETFFATLQLIDRIVRVSMTHTLEQLRKMSWTELVETDHTDLNNYLASRKLITCETSEYPADNDNTPMSDKSVGSVIAAA